MSFWQKARVKLSAFLKSALALALFECSSYIVVFSFLFFGIDRKIYRGAYNFLTSVLIFVAIFVFHKISSRKNEPLIKLGKLRPDQVAALIIVGIGMLGFVTTYLNIAKMIAAYLEPVSEAVEEYHDSVDRFSDVPQTVVPVWDSLLYIFTLCFIVPITEEMTFRGAVFGQLRKGFGPWISVIVSAVFFGLFHGLTVHIGYAFVCGLVIASCYYLTDSLFAPILLHMVFNVFGSGLPTLLSLDFLEIPDEKTIPFMMGLNTVCILFMPFAVLAYVYLVSVKRKLAKKAAANAEIIAVSAAKDIKIAPENISVCSDGSYGMPGTEETDGSEAES